MRSKRYWVWAALLAGLWASPAVAQPHWITFHIGGGFNDAQAVKLTYWINDTCRPDEMGHIAGFSYQEAPGKPLNLQVYCRKGDTGKLGKIKVVRSAYPSVLCSRSRSQRSAPSFSASTSPISKGWALRPERW